MNMSTEHTSEHAEQHKEFLTALEIATRLDVHQGTIRRWAAEGLIESRKFGHLRRFPADAVERFLENGSPIAV
jgi:excisionase family DNA binding protein